jgi:hypothetical protein
MLCLLQYVGLEFLTAADMNSSIFCDITPYSPLKVNRRFGGTCFHLETKQGTSLLPAFTLVSCLAYSSILKMDATCSSEASVEFQRTTRRYIPEDGIRFDFGSIFPLLYTTL